MNVTNFLAAYNESRNGVNQFFRHPLMRVFTYSDGVQAVAESGMYWLVDLAAFELSMKLATKRETLGVITLKVKDSEGTITMTDGEWMFYLADESDHEQSRFVMILPSEY